MAHQLRNYGLGQAYWWKLSKYFVCFVISDCVYPHNIQYTIKHQGLGCTAGIGRFLSNPQLISFAATLILLLKSLCS
jgi:hypothetical protein